MVPNAAVHMSELYGIMVYNSRKATRWYPPSFGLYKVGTPRSSTYCWTPRNVVGNKESTITINTWSMARMVELGSGLNTAPLSMACWCHRWEGALLPHGLLKRLQLRCLLSHLVWGQRAPEKELDGWGGQSC